MRLRAVRPSLSSSDHNVQPLYPPEFGCFGRRKRLKQERLRRAVVAVSLASMSSPENVAARVYAAVPLA
jgi:hypothetical protein